MTTYAVLSDIHGNLPALDAVVADLGRRPIDRVVTLGDHVSGPLWPRETAAFLMAQPWVHVSGNHERQLLSLPRGAQGLSDAFASASLEPAHLAWLAALPFRVRLEGDLLLFHGTPDSDDSYLLETLVGRRRSLATHADIGSRLGGASAAVMLCGHSHIPRVVRIGARLIVNPGSVGLQAYDDDVPEPHLMEVGSPDARYAVVERCAAGWRVELVSVPYDHEAAARRADANGRPDWVVALRTGFMEVGGE